MKGKECVYFKEKLLLERTRCDLPKAAELSSFQLLFSCETEESAVAEEMSSCSSAVCVRLKIRNGISKKSGMNVESGVGQKPGFVLF